MVDRLDIVTIDGPSGVGKSTVSRKVAAALGYTYLDTGAMYRGVAFYLIRHHVDDSDPSVVAEILQTLNLELLPAGEENGEVGVKLNGEDVSRSIRTPEMSMEASRISALSAVREKLTSMQREIGCRERVVAEGRDTGTVVFPEAAHKFFLDARPTERARRRVRQLQTRGELVDEAEILALTLTRDKNDRERPLAPLCRALDAVVIDTTEIDIDEVTRQILAVVAEHR
jgi:CMP/dCMP kinase